MIQMMFFAADMSGPWLRGPDQSDIRALKTRPEARSRVPFGQCRDLPNARRRESRWAAARLGACRPARIAAMTRLSLPKDKIRILLLEGINDSSVAMFADNGYASLERLPKALDAGALKAAVKGVHLLGIRSRSQVTEEILEAADRLLAVG